MRKLLPILGILLFLYILSRVDLAGVLRTLKSADPRFLLAALAVNYFTLLHRGFKWNLLLESVGLRASLRETVSASLLGLFAAAITPGRLGNFMRYKFLSDEAGTPPGRTLFTVVVDNAFFLSTAVLLLGFLLGAVFFLPVVIPVLFSPVLLYLKPRLGSYGMERVFKAVPNRFKTMIEDPLQEFHAAIGEMKKHREAVFWSFTLNIIMWLFIALVAYLLGVSLHLEVPYLYALLLATLSASLIFIPSLWGLGTREAAFILLLSPLGILPEEAVTLSLIYMVVTSWSLEIIGGMIGLRRVLP